MGRKWDYRSLAKEGVRGDAACTSAKPSNKNKGGKKKKKQKPKPEEKGRKEESYENLACTGGRINAKRPGP